MAEGLEASVAALEERAAKVKQVLSFASRAFVIEFAGTPKAGKSTSVEAVRHFFTRSGYRVHVLTERAAVCPIPMKGHLFFNTWCAASMLAELLANVDTETDIIIVDRGIFDSLAWLVLQEQRGELTAQEARTIEGFLLLERWRSLVDLAVLVNVSAEEALTREQSQRITSKGGSIMNLEVLRSIGASVDEAQKRYGPKFGSVIVHKTTGEQVRESNVALVDKILDTFERFLNPEILVVPRRELDKLPLRDGGSFGREAVKAALSCISSFGKFLKRDVAESSEEYVQIIPCALLTLEDRVFVFQRKENDPKYRLYGSSTVWQGCHVSQREGVGMPQLLTSALAERVSRSLFLSRVFPIEERGYCWDKDEPSSSKHFGLIYEMKIDNPHTATDLRKKEFRKKRGHGLVGEFQSISELIQMQEALNLESWSRAIVNSRRAQS